MGAGLVALLMVDRPHFALPFRYKKDGTPAVNEQGSLSDVTACVEAALRTPIGARKELPDFGTADPTFRQEPLQAQDILGQISLHEPRAVLFWDERIDDLDALVTRVTLQTSSTGEEEPRG
jgi:phage baseplate assembly protein W